MILKEDKAIMGTQPAALSSGHLLELLKTKKVDEFLLTVGKYLGVNEKDSNATLKVSRVI